MDIEFARQSSGILEVNEFRTRYLKSNAFKPNCINILLSDHRSTADIVIRFRQMAVDP